MAKKFFYACAGIFLLVLSITWERGAPARKPERGHAV